MLIYLIGYMGSGKSTVGRMLARRMQLEFIDMDTEITRMSGKSVEEIFAEKGEEGFRLLEKAALSEISLKTDAVIATGGGAPCFYDNMDIMNATGLTIYFKMSPEKLASRLEHSKTKRPLVKNKNRDELIEFITAGLEHREPFYSRAKLIVDGDRVSDEYIARHITDYLSSVT